MQHAETLADLLAPHVAFDLCTAEQAAAMWTERAASMGSSRVYTYRSVHDAVRRGSLAVALHLYEHHPLFRVRDVQSTRLAPASGHPRKSVTPLAEHVTRLLTETEERIARLNAGLAEAREGVEEDDLVQQLDTLARQRDLLARYRQVLAEGRTGHARARLRAELLALGVPLDREGV